MVVHIKRPFKIKTRKIIRDSKTNIKILKLFSPNAILWKGIYKLGIFYYIKIINFSKTIISLIGNIGEQV